jgi:hypothetical protein
MKLETHLDERAAPEAAALRTVVARLRAAPEREPSAGLAGRILAAVDAERAGGGRRPIWRIAARPRWMGAAAALAAGLLAAVTLFDWQPCPGGADQADAAWIAACQEADGTWDPDRHGGAPSYRPALTALAALALAREPVRHAAGIDRACGALAALQTADGAFGGAGRAQYYNQALAMYALAALGSQRPCVRAALDKAVRFSRDRQSAEGGWDYVAGSEGNAAVTAWQVRALACAAERGVPEAGVPLRKGLRWLRGAARADGSVAYHRTSGARSESLAALAAHTLMTSGRPFPELPALGRHVAAALRTEPAAGADGADCYRDYAKVLAFESAGEAERAEAVRGGMRRRLRAGGCDQWQGVGGALYTHALAALAARPQ